MTPVQNAYLETYLAPLAPLLDRPDVTDLFVNRPGEVWTETITGHMERHETPQLDELSLVWLARQISAFAHQGINRQNPLVSATLPNGARVQLIGPPATRAGLVLAIRKHAFADLTLDHLNELGALEPPGRRLTASTARAPATLLARGETLDFLKEVVRRRLNIVVAGGTASGKTTFVNALLKEIPQHERLIFIEDAPELQFAQPNALGLVAVRGDQGEARVTAEDLLKASLRMRPDRIILGELRGAETLSFVRAACTGHPGSITTVHADDPEGAVGQMALMMMQAQGQLNRTDAEAYVRGAVHVWVQLQRSEGRRGIQEIRLDGEAAPRRARYVHPRRRG